VHRSFGPWARPDGSGIPECAAAALAEWRRRDRFIREHREEELNHAPLEARITLRRLVASYLLHAKARVGKASGISPSMYRCELYAMRTMLRIVDGNAPAATFGPTEAKAILEAVGNGAPSTVRHVVSGVRRLFKWATEDHGMAAPTFGMAFRPPSLREFRKARRQRRDRAPICTPEEIRVMLAASGPTLRAAILLAINGGFGASDLAAVPISALQRREGDTEPGGLRARLSYARSKTESTRAVALWPETMAAILAARSIGPEAARSPWLVPSRTGGPLVRQSDVGTEPPPGSRARRDRMARTLPPATTGTRTDLVARQFRRMIEATGIRAGTEGRPHFYLLRHTCATMAELLGDSDTRRLIMGHTPSHALDDVYVARHGWGRVEGTCDAFRAWALGASAPVPEPLGVQSCPVSVARAWSAVPTEIPDQWKSRPGRKRLGPKAATTRIRKGLAALSADDDWRWRIRLGLIASTDGP
jgi:integrase